MGLEVLAVHSSGEASLAVADHRMSRQSDNRHAAPAHFFVPANRGGGFKPEIESARLGRASSGAHGSGWLGGWLETGVD